MTEFKAILTQLWKLNGSDLSQWTHSQF